MCMHMLATKHIMMQTGVNLLPFSQRLSASLDNMTEFVGIT